MKKRTESTLVTACLRYLQCLENLGRIKWCDRLNSGAIRTGKYRMRLCRPGTPDIYVIRNDGSMVWIECKSAKGKLSMPQVEFLSMVMLFPNHWHCIAKSVDDIEDIFGTK